MSDRVALVACPSYQPELLEQALRRGIDLLGGVAQFVRRGERILIKPNLLTAASPSKAICTHPQVFNALCRILSDAGAGIRYGDSPGLGSTRNTLRASGYTAIGDQYGAVIPDFATQIKCEYPQGRLLKQMVLCPAVFDCDGIISVSKLKTHGLTRMTGAVKNLFGCVPGILKGEYHVRMPDIGHFARALLDICSRVQPRLHIMDAVVAMSGNGPRNGDPRHIGALLLSIDPVALDRAACRLIHLPEEYVPTIRAASPDGVRKTEESEVLGESISALSCPDFDIPRMAVDSLESRRHFPQFLKRYITQRPVVDAHICTRCGVCEQLCPVTPKAMVRSKSDHAPQADMDRCIRCYCCQELCPHGAIRLATPWLGRLIHRVQAEKESNQ